MFQELGDYIIGYKSIETNKKAWMMSSILEDWLQKLKIKINAKQESPRNFIIG